METKFRSFTKIYTHSLTDNELTFGYVYINVIKKGDGFIKALVYREKEEGKGSIWFIPIEHEDKFCFFGSTFYPTICLFGF